MYLSSVLLASQWKTVSPAIFAILVMHIFVPTYCRTPRILTGTKWIPVTETALDVNVAVKASGSNPKVYLLPPPSDNRYVESNQKPHSFIPLNFPSLENHRLASNNGSEPTNTSTNTNERDGQQNEVRLTSVTQVVPVYKVTTATASTTVPTYTKTRRRVNVEKFRECVFFQICEKSECFHFGRFGQCKKKSGEGILSNSKTAVNQVQSSS